MAADTVSLFVSYAHKDEHLRHELIPFLKTLPADLVSAWNDRMIPPGAEWNAEIERELRSADIILLLVSQQFLASDYITRFEIPIAMQQHELGEAVVIPVILRAIAWAGQPIRHLQCVPADARPVMSWQDRDEAWVAVQEAIEQTARRLIDKRRGDRLRLEQAQRQREQHHDRYRAKVRELAVNGGLDAVAEDTLHELRDELGLDEAQARALQDEAMRPLVRRQEALERYRRSLAKAIDAQWPLSPALHESLSRRQRELDLTDADVEPLRRALLQRAADAHQGARAAPSPAPTPAPAQRVSPAPAPARASPPAVASPQAPAPVAAAAQPPSPRQAPTPTPPPRQADRPAPPPAVTPAAIPAPGAAAKPAPAPASTRIPTPTPTLAQAAKATAAPAALPPWRDPPADLDFTKVVLAIASELKWQGSDFSMAPNIWAKKQRNARAACQVPAGEELLVLVDMTVFGSASDALVVSSGGVYFHHDASQPARWSVPLHQIGPVLFGSRDKPWVTLTAGGVALKWRDSCKISAEQAARLLTRLRKALMLEANPERARAAMATLARDADQYTLTEGPRIQIDKLRGVNAPNGPERFDVALQRDLEVMSRHGVAGSVLVIFADLEGKGRHELLTVQATPQATLLVCTKPEYLLPQALKFSTLAGVTPTGPSMAEADDPSIGTARDCGPMGDFESRQSAAWCAHRELEPNAIYPNPADVQLGWTLALKKRP